MEAVIQNLHDAEEKRDLNYRANEDERERMFVEAERRRDEEAIARREGALEGIVEQLKALPPPVVPADVGKGAAGEPDESRSAPTVPSDGAPSHRTASIITAGDVGDPGAFMDTMQEVAKRHAEDIREIIELERESAAAERERMTEAMQADHQKTVEQLEARIRLLQDELEGVKQDFETERLTRSAEDAAQREAERAEREEQHDTVRGQLTDLTNLVSEQGSTIEEKKRLMDEHWDIKQERWQQKDAHDAHTHNLLNMILESQERMLQEQVTAKEELQGQMRTMQQEALEAIQQQREAYEGTIQNMAEAWRADCEQRKQETIDAVKATANEQIPYNVQGYLDEFSRSLATEVRMLLSEVGKLREDKRNLEFQIGELLTFKSKYGPAGEFDPSWKPVMTCGPTDAAPAPEPAPEPEPDVPQPAPTAWRTVHPRQSRRRRQAPAPAPPPPEVVPPPTTSWATWQPHPTFQPSPPIQHVEHLLAPPTPSPGLFGPRSPRSSIHQG
ncbi:uncharacterized protein BXZ73DRAFT_90629 [Epithele typhae]|uniref:uncharacterized protein n=1 Tax=Epithele typhae TaxID=378194 RepID=UPI002008CFB2|nr:uncharacterized protein BXZ73DRAFT_90629 [Epithele typhae]KAH9927913.1 hypothetical protein BXZ73DRAFT_90629 [Epithele typhae]